MKVIEKTAIRVKINFFISLFYLIYNYPFYMTKVIFYFRKINILNI